MIGTWMIAHEVTLSDLKQHQLSYYQCKPLSSQSWAHLKETEKQGQAAADLSVWNTNHQAEPEGSVGFLSKTLLE